MSQKWNGMSTQNDHTHSADRNSAAATGSDTKVEAREALAAESRAAPQKTETRLLTAVGRLLGGGCGAVGAVALLASRRRRAAAVSLLLLLAAARGRAAIAGAVRSRALRDRARFVSNRLSGASQQQRRHRFAIATGSACRGTPLPRARCKCTYRFLLHSCQLAAGWSREPAKRRGACGGMQMKRAWAPCCCGWPCAAAP